MSAILDHLHALLAEARAELAKLFAHGDAEVQAVAKEAAAKLDAARDTLADDAPVLEHEVATDAEEIGHDAEEIGHDAVAAAEPVVSKAERDTEHVAAEAGHDAETAVDAAQATAAPDAQAGQTETKPAVGA